MHEYLRDSLITDIQNWLKFRPGNYVICCDNTKWTIDNFNPDKCTFPENGSIKFKFYEEEHGSYNAIKIKLSLSTPIFKFKPTDMIFHNMWIDLENMTICRNKFYADHDLTEGITTFDTKELYQCLHDKTINYDNEDIFSWTFDNFFQVIPVLASLQQLFDEMNPNRKKSFDDVIIEI